MIHEHDFCHGWPAEYTSTLVVRSMPSYAIALISDEPLHRVTV